MYSKPQYDVAFVKDEIEFLNRGYSGSEEGLWIKC